ncbi:hypothetical protein Ancab_018865 [Ancistrocladus abbreviatus]
MRLCFLLHKLVRIMMLLSIANDEADPSSSTAYDQGSSPSTPRVMIYEIMNLSRASIRKLKTEREWKMGPAVTDQQNLENEKPLFYNVHTSSPVHGAGHVPSHS